MLQNADHTNESDFEPDLKVLSKLRKSYQEATTGGVP